MRLSVEMISVAMIGWVFEVKRCLVYDWCTTYVNVPWSPNKPPQNSAALNKLSVITHIIFRLYEVWPISPELTCTPGFLIVGLHMPLILLWPGGQPGHDLPRAGGSPRGQAETPGRLCSRHGTGMLAFLLHAVGQSKVTWLNPKSETERPTWPLWEGFQSHVTRSWQQRRVKDWGQ